MGPPADCDTNPLCAGALEEYGITYPPKQREALGACDVPMATALEGKAIDIAELCSTQPAIAQFGFVVLEDDLDTQPAENIAPLVRDDYLAKVDAAGFPGAARRSLGQDDDRGTDQARRPRRRRPDRTSRMSPRTG